MKIREILEARYAVQKPNTLEVHKVARRYKEFINNHVADYDAWDEGKPAIDQKGTISQGFTSLDFTFQNKSSEDSLAWVRNFVGAYSLPYHEMWASDPRGIPIRGNDNLYTRVTIKYSEYEPANRRSVPTHRLREARYPVRNIPTKEEVLKIYKEFNEPFPYNWDTNVPKNGAPLGIEAVTASIDVGMEILFHWGTPLDDARKWLQDFLKTHNVPHTAIDVDRTDYTNEITWSIFVTYNPDKVNLKEARYTGRNPSSMKVWDRYHEILNKYEFNDRHQRPFIYGEKIEVVDVDHGDTVRHGMADNNPRNVAKLYIIVYEDTPRKAIRRVKAWINDINLPHTGVDVEDAVDDAGGVMHVTISYIDPN